MRNTHWGNTLGQPLGQPLGEHTRTVGLRAGALSRFKGGALSGACHLGLVFYG
jgi:hypothetical protein